MKGSRSGSEKPFGPLEADVMEVVWKMEAATPKEVKEALAPSRKLAYTTVMTVLSRLHEKGFVSRRKSGRAFSYSPKSSKVEFLTEHAAKAIRALANAGDRAALSYFVDAASSLDDDQLEQLEQEITHLREERG